MCQTEDTNFLYLRPLVSDTILLLNKGIDMDRKKALIIYLIGSLGQIFLVCIMVWLLRGIKVEMGYSSVAGFVAIAIGGISSAVWGTVISNKFNSKIIKELFLPFFFGVGINNKLH